MVFYLYREHMFALEAAINEITGESNLCGNRLKVILCFRGMCGTGILDPLNTNLVVADAGRTE